MKSQPVIQLKKILAPIDFSSASRGGLRLAGDVAAKFNAEIVTHYAIEPPVYPEWGYAHLTIRDLNLRREAEAQMPGFTAECGIRPGLVRRSLVTTGDADTEIVKTAKQEEADLVVVASHGAGALKRAFLGSTAERVVRYAPCPVLVVRGGKEEGGASEKGPFQPDRILVPTDFSELSSKALRYAAAFAREYGAKLLIAHVVPTTLPGEFSHLGILVEEQRIIAGAKARLSEFCAAELPKSIAVESHVFNGGPAHQICAAAEELRASLIVLSTHGHSGWKHFLLGSVTERVVGHAPCPVLVVREHEHEFLAPPKRKEVL